MLDVTRITLARAAQGLSQRQLAKRAEMSYTYIQLLERGEASPTLRTLERLATALGLSVSDLIAGDIDREADSDAEKLADWLTYAPEDKRAFVLDAARMAGFGLAMSRAAS